jgi:hypothetical protein
MGKLPRALSADWPQEPCSVLRLHNRGITPPHRSMLFRHPVATGLGGNLFGTTTGAYGDGPEYAFVTRLFFAQWALRFIHGWRPVISW